MDCPSEQELIAFAHGELDSESAERIDLHLHQCEVCSDAIAWFEQHLQMMAADESSLGDSLSESSSANEEPESGDLWLERARKKFDFRKLKQGSRSDTLGRLGRFDVLSLIGVGGMGVVFRCFDREQERIYAIKVLSDELTRNDEYRERFRREAKAAAGLHHENIVRVDGCEDIDGLNLLVMECVEGVTLSRLVRKRGPLSVDWAIDIAKQIARGLCASHARGTVHRDVKPSNIILTDDQCVKLTDFGLARVAVDDSQLTKSGVMVGTPAYMAPEQVVLEDVDGRADLFSLGCVLYFMLTGRSPFQGRTSAEMAYRVVHDDVEPLKAMAPECPEILSDIVMQLLAKHPEQRVSNAEQLIELLDQIDTEDLPPPKLEESSPPPRSFPSSTVFSFCAAAAVLLASGFFFYGNPDAGSDVPKQIIPSEPRVLTVGENAQYATIKDALSDARGGDTILVARSGAINEAIRLGGANAGVKIDFADSVVTAGEDANELIRIEGGEGIEIRNVQLHPKASQHAVTLHGSAAGLRFEGVLARAASDGDRSLFNIERNALGKVRSPIVIDRCRFHGGDIGISISGDDLLGRMLIQNSDFRRTRQGVRIVANAEHITITNCAFLNNEHSIAFQLKQTGDLEAIRIENNTMVQCQEWFSIETKLERYNEDIFIARNLAVDCVGVSAPTSMDSIIFEDNVWRVKDQAMDTMPFATPVYGKALVDLREDAATFLHPMNELKSYAPEGVRIGAFPRPDDESPSSNAP